MKKRITKMAGFKALAKKYGEPISNEEYKDLVSYATKNSIRLSGFKHFVGDINIIKQVIDDILPIAKDFPLILAGRKGVILELDYSMGTDFATAMYGHIIMLNGAYFSNIEILSVEYDNAVKENRFVKGTNWRSIIRHELGHIVANKYGIKPMQIAKNVLKTNSELKVLEQLADELSLYSVEYEDGREIISEAFSGYYSNANNDFANEYVKSILSEIKIVKEAGNYETL